MKKFLVALLFVSLCTSFVSAQMLIGGRGAGMGGAGVAASHGLDAAYYNPACLMRSDVKATELDIALGAGYSDLNKLSSALSNVSSPAKFLLDNYATNLSFSGDLAGLVGLNIRKVGISVIPLLQANVNKPANSLGGTVTANGMYNGVLTLGNTFSVPFLPAALDFGANLKAVNAAQGNATVSAAVGSTTATGTQVYGTGTGVGCDLGVLTTFDVPYVSKLAVGAVIRDLAESYTLKSNTRSVTLNQLTGVVTEGPETALPDQTVTVDSSTAIGAYATIPVVGLGVAADLEMTKTATNTHLGLEYPLLLNTIYLRAGIASGPNLGLTTYGAEVDLRVVKIALVAASDSKNSGLTRTYADIKIGL
ncbi:MAG: hypothetical protein MUC35_02000 [Candidatus Margulisbacteria bacterium]|jgi:hypothetical protein|nr:hypothetical protein [Candidatus Margulisiibacteriota bacterium]